VPGYSSVWSAKAIGSCLPDHAAQLDSAPDGLISRKSSAGPSGRSAPGVDAANRSAMAVPGFPSKGRETELQPSALVAGSRCHTGG